MCRCRDHRDTKLEIELRMSSNEKEEEERKTRWHTSRARVRNAVRSIFLLFVKSINDFEIFCANREADITGILAK